MRKLVLTFIICAAAQSLFSQQDTLLKTFKYRIDHYRAIGLNLNSGGNYSRDELAFGTNKQSNLSGNAGATFYSLKSTDRILFSSNAGLNTTFNSSKSTNTTEENTNSGFALFPAVSFTNKWFTRNNFFTEAGATVSGNVQLNTNKIWNYPSIGKHNLNNYSITFTVGLGKGRLENITDMQNALWLCKELQAEKSISSNLPAADLLGLGRSITRGNNTRVLDARKRTKFILETIDGYLQQKGLVTKTDFRYFSSLNDIVFFAFNNQRLAGTERFIRITPGIERWNDNTSQNDGINKNERRYTRQSIVLNAGLSKYNPATLVHQNNYGTSLRLCYIATDYLLRFIQNGTVTSENKGKPTFKQAGVDLFFEHAIYPNTRTIINIGLQTQTGYQDADGLTGFYGSAALLGSMSYFISYRTRFTASVGTAYSKNIYQTSQVIARQPNNIHLNANAGIEISL